MPSPFPNPPVAVSALIQPMTGEITLAVIIASLVSMGIRADLWPKEGVAISCMTAVSNLFAAAFNASILPAIKSGWLPTAMGNWLEWLALYMYGVAKVHATFATGQVTLTNSGGATFNFNPFEVTFQNVDTQATYTNTDPIALAAGPSTQTIHIQATEQGTASNAIPGQVTVIVTTMLGVTANNTAAVLGIDDQSDASLQLECWNAIAANSPFGPRQSFAYAVQTALNSVTFSPVNVNRFTISPSSHTGQVAVVVASPTGAPDPNDVTGVANNIEAIARPECVTVSVTGATTVVDADTLVVYVTATVGLDAGTVQTAIVDALTAFFQTYPIGGRTVGSFSGLFASAIDGVCFGAWPGVFDVQGANDLALTSGQVATNSTTVDVRLVT